MPGVLCAEYPSVHAGSTSAQSIPPCMPRWCTCRPSLPACPGGVHAGTALRIELPGVCMDGTALRVELPGCARWCLLCAECYPGVHGGACSAQSGASRRAVVPALRRVGASRRACCAIPMRREHAGHAQRERCRVYIPSLQPWVPASPSAHSLPLLPWVYTVRPCLGAVRPWCDRSCCIDGEAPWGSSRPRAVGGREGGNNDAQSGPASSRRRRESVQH